MSEHKAVISWRRQTAGFDYQNYNRRHDWSFENGVQVSASSAPEFLGDPDCVDPEEAFVAAIASCHMLTFLAIAARKRIVVNTYEDNATGFMEKNKEGRLAVTRVELRPKIIFADDAPDAETLDHLHHLSHEQCFIANSVNTNIIVHTHTK